jgi:hypothetical protein
LRVDAGPKGLPEKTIWTDPIFNRGGVMKDFLFFNIFMPCPLKTPLSLEPIKRIKN